MAGLKLELQPSICPGSSTDLQNACFAYISRYAPMNVDATVHPSAAEPLITALGVEALGATSYNYKYVAST